MYISHVQCMHALHRISASCQLMNHAALDVHVFQEKIVHCFSDAYTCTCTCTCFYVFQSKLDFL